MDSKQFEQTKTEVGYRRFREVMRSRLRIHQDKKGDSWLTCDIDYLEKKLFEEIQEYLTAKKHRDKKEELIDIANVCMMLYNRHFALCVSGCDKNG